MRQLLTLLVLTVFCNVASGQYSLTILHNNDGESRVINAGSGLEEFGGVARFATMVNQTRTFYEGLGHGVLTISSGDNFLAGPEFEASRQSGTYYDALALNRIQYDAVILGNHEFDLGTGVLRDFINQAQSGTHTTNFLSANLDVSGDANLSSLGTNGLIAPTKLIDVATSAGNKRIGIIGATTENLPFISSPGDVVVNSVANAVNNQITNLQNQGADHIILASHLQGISEDQALVSQLNSGIDLMIAGGGDDRLASLGANSPGNNFAGAPGSIVDTGLVTGEVADGAYPTISSLQDLGGNNIPIVATDANYKYLGRITLNVDALGNISVGDSSNPQRIASTTEDAIHGVVADATVQAETVDPVQSFVNGLAGNIIGFSSQQVVGGGSSDLIRSAERNGGNLVADAIFAKATELAGTNGVDSPTIAMVNGGGIRADIAAGDISLLDTFNVSRFQNSVSIVEDVTIEDLKLLLENAYSKTVVGPNGEPIRQGDGTGRFAHLSGMSVVYNITDQAMVLDNDGNIVTAGERIKSVILDDGTVLIQQGEVVFNGTIDIATLNFLAAGGDQYFDPDYLSQAYSFTNLGATDQQSLADYISSFNNSDLASDSRYDLTADGRIIAVPEPGFASVCLVGMFAFFRRRRK